MTHQLTQLTLSRIVFLSIKMKFHIYQGLHNHLFSILLSPCSQCWRDEILTASVKCSITPSTSYSLKELAIVLQEVCFKISQKTIQDLYLCNLSSSDCQRFLQRHISQSYVVFGRCFVYFSPPLYMVMVVIKVQFWVIFNFIFKEIPEIFAYETQNKHQWHSVQWIPSHTHTHTHHMKLCLHLNFNGWLILVTTKNI